MTFTTVESPIINFVVRTGHLLDYRLPCPRSVVKPCPPLLQGPRRNNGEQYLAILLAIRILLLTCVVPTSLYLLAIVTFEMFKYASASSDRLAVLSMASVAPQSLPGYEHRVTGRVLGRPVTRLVSSGKRNYLDYEPISNSFFG